MSFFDEDDEPRTRVRPRRSSTATAGRPDRQTVLVRQLVLLGGFILIVALLIFVVNGCRNSAKENSLKDYNSDVASIVRDSDSQVGKPFFDLLRNPSTGDLSTQVAGYKVQAEQQYEQAKKISTPGDMTAAQRSFLIAMEMRRDGLEQIASQVRTALSSDTEAADRAINEIAGAMQMFLTSDVIYSERVIPLIEDTLRDADVGAQRLQQSQFLPGIEWLQPATVADALGQQLSAGGSGNSGREPAPGLHGTGIDSVEVGDQTLDAELGQPDRLRAGHRVQRQLHQPGRERRGRHRRDPQDRGRSEADPRHQERALGRRRRPGDGHARARLPAAVRHRRDHLGRGQGGPGRAEDGQQQGRVRRAVLAAVALVSSGSVNDLTDPAGIAALSAGALALIALVATGVLALRVRRLRAAQQVVLGPLGREDLVDHAARLQEAFGHAARAGRGGRGPAGGADGRGRGAARRRDHLPRARPLRRLRRAVRPPVGVARAARRQRNGVVLSSIAHRDTARLYCKQVVGGRGEHLLSPEEDEAIRRALAGERTTAVLED